GRLPVGTVHPATRSVVFGGCVVAVALALIAAAGQRRTIGLWPPLAALVVVVLVTAAQLVPLPAAAVGALSPATHDLLETTLGDYDVHALSLDPAATRAELAKLAAYLAFFVAAVAYLRRSGRRRQVGIAVAGLPTVVAA